MTLRSEGSTCSNNPRSSFAAPVPPARATSFTGEPLDARLPSGAGAHAGGGIAPRRAPQRRAAAPAEEAHAGPSPKRLGQLGLWQRNEAVADPEAIQPLGPREHRVDPGGLRVMERG